MKKYLFILSIFLVGGLIIPIIVMGQESEFSTSLPDPTEGLVFRLASDPTVYAWERHVTYYYDDAYSLVRFCSARTYELATQDYNFDRVVMLDDALGAYLPAKESVPCGGIPYYRPFKFTDSSAVYYQSNYGLRQYCTEEQYHQEHDDPTYYWVVEFDPAELTLPLEEVPCAEIGSDHDLYHMYFIER